LSLRVNGETGTRPQEVRYKHPGACREGLDDVADNRYQLQLAWILAQVDRLGRCKQLNVAASVGDEPVGRQEAAPASRPM